MAVRKVENRTSKAAAVGRVITFISILSGLGTHQMSNVVAKTTCLLYRRSTILFQTLFASFVPALLIEVFAYAQIFVAPGCIRRNTFGIKK